MLEYMTINGTTIYLNDPESVVLFTVHVSSIVEKNELTLNLDFVAF